MTTRENLVRDELMTIDAVASHLKLSRATVYNLISRGEIQTVKIGRSRRVPATALARFVTGHIDAA